MTTYNTRRKNRFSWLFALVTVTTLAVPYVAFGAGRASGRSGSFTASGMHGRPSFSHRFNRFDRFNRFGFFDGDGFLDGDGFDDQQVVITQQSSSAPTTSAPPENRVYVQPHWVDGGYGVQVLQPGYWTVPK
jgi:hypothetical protein